MTSTEADRRKYLAGMLDRAAASLSGCACRLAAQSFAFREKAKEVRKVGVVDDIHMKNFTDGAFATQDGMHETSATVGVVAAVVRWECDRGGDPDPEPEPDPAPTDNVPVAGKVEPHDRMPSDPEYGDPVA